VEVSVSMIAAEVSYLFKEVRKGLQAMQGPRYALGHDPSISWRGKYEWRVDDAEGHR
jgi:hypothetical protein